MAFVLLDKYNLKNFPFRINWEITKACNFSCSYCINQDFTASNPSNIYSPEQIASFFNMTGREWLILITGGEPFVYPRFSEICFHLTQKHFLNISTNLSSSDVFNFADTINPSKIFIISASFHYTERKRLGLVDDFIEKCKYLKNKGFIVLVNYVAHPEGLSRLEEFVTLFKSLGISSFALVLRGVYNTKKYPESYTESELLLIKKYILDDTIELNSAFGKLNFYRKYCTAGQTYFFMDNLGNISRCSTLQKPIGNLFENNINYDKKPKPCITKNCNDVYCGVAAVTKKKSFLLETLLEKRKYYCNF